MTKLIQLGAIVDQNGTITLKSYGDLSLTNYIDNAAFSGCLVLERFENETGNFLVHEDQLALHFRVTVDELTRWLTADTELKVKMIDGRLYVRGNFTMTYRGLEEYSGDKEPIDFRNLESL